MQLSDCVYRENIILTSDFNKKFASAFIFSSVKHSILDFMVAFWKMGPWWQAFQYNTKTGDKTGQMFIK